MGANKFHVFKGMIAGAALAVSLGLAYAYGHSRAGEARADVADVQNALDRGACKVEVGYGSLQVGDHCMYDEVMVGTRSGYLLCADIEVTCTGEE